MRRAAVLGLVLSVVAVPLAAQTAPVRVKLGGRMQFQWNSTSVTEAEAGTSSPIAASTFETRRVRLSADVEVGDWIRGTVEPEFALGQLRLRNAWVGFSPTDNLTVRAGQMKKPFSLLDATSSTTFPLIERGLRIRGLDALLQRDGGVSSLRGPALAGEHFALIDAQGYTGYDMGITLEGGHGGLSAALGAYNGSGADTRDENDAKSLAARVGWQPSGSVPLQLGASWSRRELNMPGTAGPVEPTGDAVEVDVQYGGFRQGAWLLAEGAIGDNLATEARFTSAQLLGAWFIPTGGARVEGVEPAFRISWADPDDTVPGDAGVLITPGINLYAFGRNRLMLNWDVYLPDSDAVETQHALRTQFNLHF